jgi:ubiquinone biosynthesis protein
MLISASLIYGLDGYSPPLLGGTPVLTWVLGGLALGLLVFAWQDGD